MSKMVVLMVRHRCNSNRWVDSFYFGTAQKWWVTCLQQHDLVNAGHRGFLLWAEVICSIYGSKRLSSSITFIFKSTKDGAMKEDVGPDDYEYNSSFNAYNGSSCSFTFAFWALLKLLNFALFCYLLNDYFGAEIRECTSNASQSSQNNNRD